MNFILFRILIGRMYKKYSTFELLPKAVFNEYIEIVFKKNSNTKFFIADMIRDSDNFRITKKQVYANEYILHALYSDNKLYNRDIALVFFLFDNLNTDKKTEIIKEFIRNNFELFYRINEFLSIANTHRQYYERLQDEPLYNLIRDILPPVDPISIIECHLKENIKKIYKANDKNDFFNFIIKKTKHLANKCNYLIEYTTFIENDQEFIHDSISFIFGHVYTKQKNKDIIKKYDTQVILSTEREEPYMFTIGNDTINKMNCIKVEIQTNDIDQMSRVIGTLKSSIDRYKKFSNVGFFKKMFSSKLEIQANITISVINFESALDSGHSVRERLQKQYDSFEKSSIQLKNIFDEFSKNLEELNTYIERTDIDHHAKERLLRRKNDLMAAQILCSNSAAQFELSMSNIITLIDKFTTIEKILKPVITQNMQLTKEMNRLLK